MPFSMELDESGEERLQRAGPKVRTGVDPGVDVIDLTAMREALEADRQRGR